MLSDRKRNIRNPMDYKTYRNFEQGQAEELEAYEEEIETLKTSIDMVPLDQVTITVFNNILERLSDLKKENMMLKKKTFDLDNDLSLIEQESSS